MVAIIGWTPEQYTAFWTAVYALAAVATVVVLTVAAIIGRGQLRVALGQRRDEQRDRHTQRMTELSQRWDRDDMLAIRIEEARFASPDALRHKMQRLYPRNKRKAYELLRIPNFFEDVAIMTLRGSVPVPLVQAYMGTTVVAHWVLWEEWTRYFRETYNQPTYFENFQELAARMEAGSAVAEEA